MIISFSWTTPALLAGAKTVTRRDWSDRTAKLAERCWADRKLVDAYDKSPRVGGKRVARIFLTHRPLKLSTAGLGPEEWRAEGFEFFGGQRVEIGTKMGDFPRACKIWEEWADNPRDLWVIRFHLVSKVAP